jgi:ATP-dependent RNA helicase DeaD
MTEETIDRSEATDQTDRDPTLPETEAGRVGAHDNEIFDTEQTFEGIGLRKSVLKGITDLGFVHPTAIQAKLIPPALEGKDILGQAKTGTGKTAAFGLPLYHMVEKGTPGQALILAPTRELAIQIADEFVEFGKHTPLNVCAIYGGQKISTQAKKLERRPEIIVGTPGRVKDMNQRGLLPFKNIKFAILDEVDRMLDIGFRDEIRDILGKCPKERQTIFVSATISPEIEKLARKYMNDPEKIVTSAGSLTVAQVRQFHLPVQPWDKKRLLKHLLTHEEPDLTLVFCRLKRSVDDLVRYLSKAGIEASGIHADLRQSQRNQVMQKLHKGHLSVLIASDLASRGLDVDGITHVINYDLPEDIEIYVHRIGRTARAGRDGIAWSLVTPDQGELLTDIEMLINSEIPKLEYPDFKPGEPPESYQREKDEAERRNEALKARNRYKTADEAPVIEKVDESKFPGGIVPSKMPPKRMHGRMRSGRR